MIERWIRRATYGGVWHRATEADTPICGTVLRGGSGDFEIEEKVPYTRHVSYVCLKCYRIERGVDRPISIDLSLAITAIRANLDELLSRMEAVENVTRGVVGRVVALERRKRGR